MKESLESYVRSKRNAAVFEALDSLAQPFPKPVKLFVYGPKHSSKSTFVRSVANSAPAQSEMMQETVFACSGADIAIALQFEADDSFFERLGNAPIVIIDDLVPLLSHEKGAQLLDLMIAQRNLIGGSTFIMSDVPFSELALGEALDALNEFDRHEFAPLDDEERAEFVRVAMNQYQNANSPMVDNEAVRLIVTNMGNSFVDMENAARYLMTDEDCAARTSVSGQDARELFELE